MSKHPEQFTIEAWSANAIAFIEDQGLTREFSDWCGGWPCPVDPKMVTAAPALVDALGDLRRVIDIAGLQNLSNGVQLGQTSWFVKASDAVAQADEALSLAKGEAA